MHRLGTTTACAETATISPACSSIRSTPAGRRNDRTRADDVVIGRQLFGYVAQFSPSRIVSRIGVDGTAGK